jgi:serine/threonine-protein kinase
MHGDDDSRRSEEESALAETVFVEADPAVGAVPTDSEDPQLAETILAAGSPTGQGPGADARGPAQPVFIGRGRALSPGEVLFGEYEIVNVLGTGGMGEVYRAKHRRLDEPRAIKVMHAELSTKTGASEFFYREAKALLAVRHPAVVHCHDLLSDDQGRVYLIMEMIEGVPLSAKMQAGPLSPDDVAILGARVAHGLAAAHRKGVIHRDLSPDNIVLPNGRVQEAKIIDFGIAKLLEEGENTIIDGFKGKLTYASPEQLGFHGGAIDGRSDFYSLGLLLAAAALGKPMSMGTTVVEAVDARRNLTELPDAIPMGLRSAIQPLLALDPADRPRYVDRLFIVPGGVEGSTNPGGDPAGRRVSSARAESKQGRFWRAGSIVAAISLVVAGGYYALEERPSPEAAQGTVRPSTTSGSTVPDAPDAASATPRVLTARDRLQIIGLINNARSALEEDRLMTPPGDNAFERFSKVLVLDPTDKRALEGLREIADRYVALAEGALDRGDREAARGFADRARRADEAHAGIRNLERRLER